MNTNNPIMYFEQEVELDYTDCTNYEEWIEILLGGNDNG